VQLDVIIYGASLLLEFVALAVLRVKDPETKRPFRVPGGLPGAVLLGVVPMGLIVFSMVTAQSEEGGGWVVGIVAGVVVVGLALSGARRFTAAGRAAMA